VVSLRGESLHSVGLHDRCVERDRSEGETWISATMGGVREACITKGKELQVQDTGQGREYDRVDFSVHVRRLAPMTAGSLDPVSRKWILERGLLFRSGEGAV